MKVKIEQLVFEDVENHLDYYIYIGEDCKAQYLHRDGQFRRSTRNEKGEYTGYFSTRKEVEDLCHSLGFEIDNE